MIGGKLNNEDSGMKIFVTGGAGFIGSYVVDELVKEHSVCVIDNFSTGARHRVNTKAKLVEKDIIAPDLKQIFEEEKPEVIIHLAAISSVKIAEERPLYTHKVNCAGTLRLLELSKKYGVKKFIFASSAAVYGDMEGSAEEDTPQNPKSTYGLSKWVAERYIEKVCTDNSISFAILRLANVFGPGQSHSGEGGVVSIFIQELRNKKRPTVFGTGEQSRDFVFVKDVASAVLKAMARRQSDILNISTGRAISINALWSLIKKIGSYDQDPLFVGPRKDDIRWSQLSNARAKAVLDWQPGTLEEGLKETMSLSEQ